jgi:hypothetical protein
VPRIAVKTRFSLYFALNVAFLLLVGVAYAIGGAADPRILHLFLLFALCSSFVIDLDGLNGRFALLALFMLVYFVSYGVGDLTHLFMDGGVAATASAGSHGVFSETEGVILIGGVMLVLGYRFAVMLVDGIGIARLPRDWSKSMILVIGPILWVLGTYAVYQWYVYIVPDTTNVAFRKGIGSISTLRASAYILGQMMQPLGVMLLAYALRSFRSALLPPVVIGIVVLQILLGFVLDMKGLAMLGGVMVIVTSVLVSGRLPRSWLVAFAVYVMLVFPVFQAYRTMIHGTRGLSRTTVLENFGKVLQLTLEATEQVNTGHDRAQTFLERSSVKGSTEMIVEKTGNGVEFQRGYTLTPLLATFIPKIIWSDKYDVPVGQLVNKQFHVTDSDDIYISPSHLGELYWNFGWPGVIAGMGVIGLLCGWVGARFNLAEYKTVTRLLITVVTIKQLIVGFEGAIAPIYVVWLRSLGAIGILHVLFARVPVSLRWDAAHRPHANLPAPGGSGTRAFPNLLT